MSPSRRARSLQPILHLGSPEGTYSQAGPGLGSGRWRRPEADAGAPSPPGGAGGRPSHPRPHLLACLNSEILLWPGLGRLTRQSPGPPCGSGNRLCEYCYAHARGGLVASWGLRVLREGQRHKVTAVALSGGFQGTNSRHLGRSRGGVAARHPGSALYPTPLLHPSLLPVLCPGASEALLHDIWHQDCSTGFWVLVQPCCGCCPGRAWRPSGANPILNTSDLTPCGLIGSSPPTCSLSR